MTRRDFLYTVPALAAAVSAKGAVVPENPAWKLWYRQPAVRWLDSLPVGNGRLGAMVFGGAARERIALNESTVWSGSPNASNVNPSGHLYLAEVRQLLFAGRYVEANALFSKHLLGREDSYGTHLPLADLFIDSGEKISDATNYCRSLDLETGIARVDYSYQGVEYRREVFVSNPDNVMVVRLTASKPASINFSLSLSPGSLPGQVTVRNDVLLLTGSAWEKRHSDGKLGVNFEARVQVLNENGSRASAEEAIEVRKADAVTILIAADTNYHEADFDGLCSAQIKAAAVKSYVQLRDAHEKDHRKLFNRVAIDLGGAELAHTPTDERLAALSASSTDVHLSALFFQYGRYLLIAGSRENSPLPMNLQGIWNDNLAANMVWTCDFHLDINTQQNYWHSETCNLSECGEPLFKLVEDLREKGRSTARSVYGASGWVAHVYTDAWGFTASGVGIVWGPFVTGGIWAASHLWEHYLFTGDRAFLEQRAYPVLKEAAAFFLDYMVREPKHNWLVTGPSISPENSYLSPDGKRCSVSMGPTCDRVLVHALFSSCIEAATVLQKDPELRARLEECRASLSPLQIGKHGQLQEWLEDFDEAEPNHRHTSHLLALYPFDQITPESTPDLAKAARVTLERRTMQKNWEDTEWSRANLINFFARLRDGESAHIHLMGLLREDTDHNLLTFSRAGVAGAKENIFAIDGNTAGTAGMVEMLLQSHHDIELLPALPKAWPAGSLQGVRARGGFEVDLHWSASALTSAKIRSEHGGRCNVRYGSKTVALQFKRGSIHQLDQNLKIIA